MSTGHGSDVFEDAKGRSLQAYLEQTLGCSAYKCGSQVRMDSCPHCGESMSGSAKMRITNDRTWHCFGCGQGGTIIDAALQLQPGLTTPLMAAQEIVHGVIPPTISPAQRQQQVEADQRKVQWQEWVLHRIHEASRQAFDPAVWDYLLHTRGLDAAVVNEAWHRGVLGTMPAQRDKATAWLKSVVGETELRYAGLWKEDADHPWIAHRPLVQFVDNHQYAEFRLLYKPTNTKTKKSLAVGRPGVPYFWNATVTGKCLVTEACLEMLAALSLGYDGRVLAASGTGASQITWFQGLAAQGTTVFELAFNNDHWVDEHGVIHNPGREAQMQLAKDLTALGIACTDASPREVGDINDALLRTRRKRA